MPVAVRVHGGADEQHSGVRVPPELRAVGLPAVEWFELAQSPAFIQSHLEPLIAAVREVGGGVALPQPSPPPLPPSLSPHR